MRLIGRLLIGLVVLIALLGGAVAGLAWYSVPPPHLETAIPGLSAAVHIDLDNDGIPRIRAANATDAAAALGFMHARDRLFQMDMMRRAASGRLSEIAGSPTLRYDRTMRILGLRRRAESDLTELGPDTRALLDAYARGVNAWIDHRGRFAAAEFVALGPPEPWSAVDCLLWGKTMAVWLSGNWRQELNSAALLGRMPPDKVRALWPSHDATPGPAASLGATAARLAAAVPAFPEPFTLPAEASNEWAVTGEHSATGAPLLAGDPHLGFSMPAIWYLARIETPDGVLAGATAPGVPFLILGHNGHVAWTFTTTGADTQDVFVEAPAGDDRYATPDGPQPFQTHDETIRVRFGEDVVQHVRETRHGPVMSDADGTSGGSILAVAMANLAPHDTAADGLLALNRATTIADVHRAAPLISAPVQNLLAADKTDIGQFTTGRIPLRRAGDGTLPVPGADGAHDWTGFADGDRLPHQIDPPSGHLLNANERVAPPDFPVFMGRDWFGDWRAQRIRALLDARGTHTVASFAQMQVDTVSPFALAVMPRLLRTEPLDAESRRALSLLRHWDGSMHADWSQPLLFNAWMRRIEEALLEQEGIDRFQAGPTSDMVARALGPDETAWCGPDCGSILSRTLAQATRDVGDATWGSVHQAEFQHPLLGRLPLIGRLFTWTIDQPGDDTTLFRGSPRSPGWESVHGPAFRGVYDLADLDRSLFALAPGQSGNPFATDASSIMAAWRIGTNIRLGPSAKAVDTVELHP